MPTEELYGNYNFVVQVGSRTVGRCISVDGKFGPETQAVKAIKPASLPGNRQSVKLCGFKPELPLNEGLRAWWDPKYSGVPSPKSGALLRIDRMGRTLERWNFTNGWPAKWEAPELDASANDVAIETLELSCERIDHA